MNLEVFVTIQPAHLSKCQIIFTPHFYVKLGKPTNALNIKCSSGKSAAGLPSLVHYRLGTSVQIIKQHETLNRNVRVGYMHSIEYISNVYKQLLLELRIISCLAGLLYNLFIIFFSIYRYRTLQGSYPQRGEGGDWPH